MNVETRAILMRFLAEWDRTLNRQRALRDQLDAMLITERPAPTAAEKRRIMDENKRL